MDSNIVLSIIIPVYNSERYLFQCLSSIPNRYDIEVILIDDGSTDNSMLVYNSFTFYNFVIRKIPNSGVSTARNTGISLAHGKWIMFLDSDDYLDKSFDRTLSYLYDNFDEETLVFSNKLSDDMQNESKKDFLKRIVVDNGVGLNLVLSKFYRKDLIIRHQLFFCDSLINGEDMIFNLNYLFLFSYKLIKESFYVYRKNMNSSTNRFNEKIILNENMFQAKFNECLVKYHKDFDSDWRKIYEFTILNSLLVVLYRGALVSKFDVSIITSICKKDIYINVLTNLELFKPYFTRLQLFKLRLLKDKKVKISLLLTKVQIFIKKIYYFFIREKNVRL